MAVRIFCESADGALHDLISDSANSAGMAVEYIRQLRHHARLLSVWPPTVHVVLRPVDSGFFAAFLGVLDAL